MRTSQKIGVGALVLIAVATVVAIKNPMPHATTAEASMEADPLPPDMRTLDSIIKLQGAPCGYVRHAQRVSDDVIVGTCTNGLAYRAVHVAGGWQLQRAN